MIVQGMMQHEHVSPQSMQPLLGGCAGVVEGGTFQAKRLGRGFKARSALLRDSVPVCSGRACEERMMAGMRQGGLADVGFLWVGMGVRLCKGLALVLALRRASSVVRVECGTGFT